VKPSRGGSALGLTIVRSAAELPSAMVTAYAYGEIVLIERFIEGVEVALSIVEDEHGQAQALPAVEIVPDGGVYSYEARYTAGATEFFTPARLSSSGADSAADVSLAAYRTLGHAVTAMYREDRAAADLARAGLDLVLQELFSLIAGLRCERGGGLLGLATHLLNRICELRDGLTSFGAEVHFLVRVDAIARTCGYDS